jgi:thioredoxin reductase (NADPH)
MAAPALFPDTTEETPDAIGAFPRLTDVEIENLSALGAMRRTQPGDVLFRAGENSREFFVVLSGKVGILEEFGRERRLLGVHGSGRFLGELDLFTGQKALVTAVVLEPGEVLAVPVENLRALVARDPNLGDKVLRACLLRRSLLIGLGSGLRVIGSRFSPDTRRLREFAARNRLPHKFIDLEEDKEAEELLRSLHIKPEETPVVILSGGQVLRNPSNKKLADQLGLRMRNGRFEVCDLIVVGAGPAGLAAAVYGASEGLQTVVLDSIATGGQAGTSPRIENYLGFPAGIAGAELAERAVIQAEKFGARISVPAAACELQGYDGNYCVGLDDGTSVDGKAVLICTGVRYRRLEVARLDEFEGTSIFYAATQVEAQYCGPFPVMVVGGGNSAGQAALFLAKQASKVWLLLRHDDLRRDMSRYLVDQIERHGSIEVLTNTEVKELVGEKGSLEAVVVEYKDGRRHRVEARLLFVFIGADPHVNWLNGQVALDEEGYILTGYEAGDARFKTLGRRPFILETSWPGVFAAGDVRSGSAKRVASAVGEGAMAVRLVHRHLGP